MVAHQATVDAADFWHVALAPGETKVLTLEQLDDLFRLDIIDAATRIWQPGMSEWLPLSVVAGLEAEPSKPKGAPPPPPSSRAPARPPSPPQRPAPAPSYSAPVPSARPVSMQPAPAAASFAAPWPGNAAPQAAPWASSASASPSFRPTPESFRPMVVSHRPAPVATGGGAGGRFVLTLAFIAGIGVTLYRNDVVRQAALSAGQEKTYLKVEAALGGPGFGTPRAVQLSGPVSLNAAVEAATASAAMPATSLPSTPQAQTPSSTPPAQEASAATEATKAPAAKADSPSPVSLSSLVAAKLPASKAKAKAERPAARPARAAARSASASAPRELGIKGSSNGYDPLNGKL